MISASAYATECKRAYLALLHQLSDAVAAGDKDEAERINHRCIGAVGEMVAAIRESWAEAKAGQTA